MQLGEVWYVRFPYEEDESITKVRPVIILDVEKLQVLSVKVTKTEPRENDEFDTPIVYWSKAKLKYKSTARVAKTILLNKSMFLDKIGDLYPDDLQEVERQYMKCFSCKEEVAVTKEDD